MAAIPTKPPQPAAANRTAAPLDVEEVAALVVVAAPPVVTVTVPDERGVS